MKIKTGLPHENNGGTTTVMFAKPTISHGLRPFVRVELSIIAVAVREFEPLVSKYNVTYFQPNLKEEHQAKIIAYAKKLSGEHVAKKGYKIINKKGEKNEVVNSTNGMRCVFELVKN